MHGWYAAADVAGTKGLEGKLRLIRASAFLRFASVGDEAAFVPPQADVPRFARIAAFEEAGEDACLVIFEEVASADLGQQLVGCTVLLKGDHGPGEDDEEGLEWLVGFTVVDPVLGEVGVIEDVDDGPQRFQPLISVRCDGRDTPVLIPLAEELISAIDDEEKRISMDLPKGILDI